MRIQTLSELSSEDVVSFVEGLLRHNQSQKELLQLVSLFQNQNTQEIKSYAKYFLETMMQHGTTLSFKSVDDGYSVSITKVINGDGCDGDVFGLVINHPNNEFLKELLALVRDTIGPETKVMMGNKHIVVCDVNLAETFEESSEP